MPNPPGLGLPNEHSYDTASPGIVVDRITCLIWERAVDPTSYTLAQAGLYCDGLVLAGYDDWRLPTFIELLSIVDYTRPAPTIDPTAFPNTPAEGFWVSTSKVLSFMSLQTVATPASRYRVRCVR
jgi:hypothetical protein